MESEIQKFYAGSTVLLTGATGFLGKVLLEKLLRGCPDLEKVYVVIRRKDGKDPKARLQEMFESPVFKRLRTENPNSQKKVFLMEGDAERPDFGFDPENKTIIKNEVNVIINNASAISFDENLRTAIVVNVGGLKSLIRIAKGMKALKAFMQISTVFSNFPRSEIEEIIYDAPMSVAKVLAVAETMTEQMLEDSAKTLLGDWPNPYVFTKAIAESLVREEGKNLPICIVRPSIVMSTYKEPMEGWNEIISGPSKMSLAFLTGVFHIPLVKKSAAADIMPADFVANAILAAGWGVNHKEKMEDDVEKYQSTIDENIFLESQKTSEIAVFNVISSTLNVINWGEFWIKIRHMSDSFPMQNMVWFQFIFLTQCKFMYFFFMYVFHYFPAMVIDFFLMATGQTQKYVKLVSEMDQMSRAMAPFVTREFIILNNKTLNLWKNMNKKDKEIFGFDVACLNWHDFLRQHVAGCRKFLAKETVDNMDQATKRHRTLRTINVLCTVALIYLIAKALACFYRLVF